MGPNARGKDEKWGQKSKACNLSQKEKSSGTENTLGEGKAFFFR